MSDACVALEAKLADQDNRIGSPEAKNDIYKYLEYKNVTIPVEERMSCLIKLRNEWYCTLGYLFRGGNDPNLMT